MTKKIKNKDLKMDLRVKHEDDRVEQSGRSMVEMLGTLAIIGVLSIGGIAGYTYAMDKYYANEIIDGVSKMALIASQQLVYKDTISLESEFGNEVAGYPFEAENDEESNSFSITVSGIPEDVCDKVLETDWTMPYDIFVNDDLEGLGACSEGENSITFAFNNALGDVSEEEGCKKGQYADTDGCKECPANLSDITSEPQCQSCGGEWNNGSCEGGCSDGAIRDEDKGCISCTHKDVIWIGDRPEECNKCDGLRELSPLFPHDCILKDCGEGYSHNGLGDCIPLCEEGEFQENTGCAPCSRYYSLIMFDEMSEEACSQCDNTDYPRTWVQDPDGTYYCALVNCPIGTIQAADGYCITCDRVDEFDFYPFYISETECDKCNTWGYNTEMDGDGFCVLK